VRTRNRYKAWVIDSSPAAFIFSRVRRAGVRVCVRVRVRVRVCVRVRVRVCASCVIW